MRWTERVAFMDVINHYKILVGKREEKKPLGRRGVDRRVLRNLPQLD
jgi:hypothetical protein